MPVKKILLSAVLGGLTFFVWGFLSHSVLPVYDNAFVKFSNEDVVIQILLANAPASGVYYLPWVPMSGDGMSAEELQKAKEAGQERMRMGPFMLAAVRLGEMAPFQGYLITQFVTDMLVALLICLVVAKLPEMSLFGRALSVELIGLAGFAAFALPQWNWYAFSTPFTLAELLDTAVGFFAAGLVIAKIISMREKPKAEQPMR